MALVLRRLALVFPAVLGSLALLLAAGATAQPAATAPDLVEVVVTLPQPPLAAAILHDRSLAAAATAKHKLNVRAPASVSYLRTLATAQRTLQARIEQAVPGAQARWHYGVVANGMAIVVPRSQLARLKTVAGATVWPSVTYHELLNRTPQLIGAPTVWGPTLASSGQGIKIGIIDDGVDQTHMFFDPTGFSYPAGFPKGNTAYTTPKVIVARAFAPATPVWKYANTPFDPQNSDHATNVAGIAAGDHDTIATVQGEGKEKVSGIAPGAYLGNYKVLTVPTPGFGLDGNSPEIVAGIEAAVKDGMDVINLSLGEPEVEPSRDIVVAALDNAADAGVVPVVAAGNDGAGAGSVSSPANAPEAISVAASTEGDNGPADVIADFSSAGPTPISLEMKPDITAPGVDILSSLPGNTWSAHDWSGTSMASPHVAGGAALLKQRHPTWTVAQIKSALTTTGDVVHAAGGVRETGVMREGGGRIDLPRADNPLIFVAPTGLSFGLVHRGSTATETIGVTDAGGGPAPWNVSVTPQITPSGATVTATPTVAPGASVTVTLTTTADAAEGEASGFIVLSRGTDTRRLPYWFRVTVPRLGTEPHALLHGPGVYHGNTMGKFSRVSSYRYPEVSAAVAIPLDLSGPEQVFRFTTTAPLVNFGAVVTSHGPGVKVSPRLVLAGDENRLVGQTGLPTDINPYQRYGDVTSAVGDVLSLPGSYDFVFDTPSRGKPGAFTFRFWVNDTTPPRIRLLSRTVSRSKRIRFAVTDAGSGVDRASISLKVDGQSRAFTYAEGIVSPVKAVTPGTHQVTVTASDYQETKNMEDVGPILPNTRTSTATVVVR
jgi:subtilisin family serine protease